MIKLSVPGFSKDFVEFNILNEFHNAEIEFVRSIYLKTDLAISKVRKIALENKIELSIHAPYFLNLASLNAETLEKSKKIIIECCKVGHKLGAKYICFHPAFYQGRDPSEVYPIVLKSVKEIKAEIDKLGLKVVLAPELMGKKSQFGSLDELVRLMKDVKGISLTVDFAHCLARNGKIDYTSMVKKLPSKFHSHFSGIQFSEKGEIRHLPINVDEFRKLVRALVKFKKNTTIVCESADVLKDLLLMKQVLKEEL